MPQFAYKARGTGGNTTAGVLEAADQRQAMDQLRSQRLIVLEINENQPGLLDAIKKFPLFKPKIPSKDIVLFSRQLSTLVSAGVALVSGLNILAEQIPTPAFKTVVLKVKEDIESGLPVADALKKHPDAFTDLYVAMIRAGEVGGILDVILERLSNYLEAAEALRLKVKGAMMYPMVVSSIAGAVTIFLLVGVIPTFKDIFSSFGAELPLPTRIVIGISESLQNYFYIYILVPAAIVFLFRRWGKTENGKKVIDAKLLQMPMFGLMLRKVAVAKFTRTLGTLVKSGVPILQAMETVAQTSGNKVIETAIMEARESIREGERIAEPLKRSGVFPPMVTQMIAVGEETGNMDTMLHKIADFYDQEVEQAIKGLTSMIEPIVIVIMGVVIGGIVVAMFIPMFELGSLAGKQG
ncbi:MAG: type II secretion system F family protein [Elusimicrobia bacterium]|jgi:type IV pilus assembly protein PilC|nr:type II secretion system F family protein [Elusimicrobiota bacterium]MBK7208200.1 type II secretion system F family protein [Elusimicrobiota bacterium]MBK7544964.1 type II secretion system F family protein [Elusimicrobiota bacterium]MBK7688155.1 type II secretion system F family protein [Elusimicrobiota bacterium]MBK8126624.1 type II secretion system F family protein [Elusimicrobiota bacterium]